MGIRQNFSQSLFDPSIPSPVSVLSMIRLNDSIYSALIDGGACPTTLMENHLVSLRLSLWPVFQKGLGAQVEAIKKLSGSTSGSMFGAKTLLKDATVQAVRMDWVQHLLPRIC
jgi:hypothetical protein